MKLILTRHGETEDNLAGIIQGHNHGKLTELGLKQAIKLALRLENEHIDVIYSSDLSRSADTANEIKLFHPDTPIFFKKELRERDFGSSTGSQSELFDWGNMSPDVETNKSMKERAEKFLNQCLHDHPESTVLVVAHNGYNKALVSVVLKKDGDYMNEIEKTKNTSVSIFEIEKNKKGVVHLFNCTEHLQPDEQTTLGNIG